MKYNFDNERPIYIQLVEQLRLDIVSGKLSKGQRLSSVRDLAIENKVNPNTIQKALLELERDKLIYTERTNGKFVTNDDKLILKTKNEIIKNKINEFLKDMNSIGINISEVIKFLKERN